MFSRIYKNVFLLKIISYTGILLSFLSQSKKSKKQNKENFVKHFVGSGFMKTCDEQVISQLICCAK